jgi:hypothetical protein
MGRTKKYIQSSIFENKLIMTKDFDKLNNKVKNIEQNQDIQGNQVNQDNQDNQVNQDNQDNYNIYDISNFKKKEKMLYDVLNDFYIKCTEEEIIKIINIINGKYNISLRFLDWFVTRYCYLYKTSIQINNIYNIEKDFNINISYKAQLKSFKKKNFDPFKRKNKFYYSFNRNTNNFSILTTLGQLNFFKWALSYDIIKYVENNFEKINSKINYVNSFFKKNIIDNSSLSFVSSEDLNSNSSDSPNMNLETNSNLSDSPNINSKIRSMINDNNTNTENNLSSKSLKKKSYNYNPIVSRKIFIEL